MASYPILNIKRNDLQPVYPFQVLNADGSAKDITGSTIRVNMQLLGAIVNKVNRAVGSVTDGVNGLCEYRWSTGDTDTEGEYEIEFEITPPSGGKFTVPADGGAYVNIKKDLDAQ